MTQETILITAITVFGSILITGLPLISFIKVKMKKTSLKPFDCSFCLSGWASMIVSIFCGYYWYQVIAFTFVVPFITAFVEYWFNKIKNSI